MSERGKEERKQQNALYVYSGVCLYVPENGWKRWRKQQRALYWCSTKCLQEAKKKENSREHYSGVCLYVPENGWKRWIKENSREHYSDVCLYFPENDWKRWRREKTAESIIVVFACMFQRMAERGEEEWGNWGQNQTQPVKGTVTSVWLPLSPAGFHCLHRGWSRAFVNSMWVFQSDGQWLCCFMSQVHSVPQSVKGELTTHVRMRGHMQACSSQVTSWQWMGLL